MMVRKKHKNIITIKPKDYEKLIMNETIIYSEKNKPKFF